MTVTDMIKHVEKNKLYLKEHNVFYCRGRKEGILSQESPKTILE